MKKLMLITVLLLFATLHSYSDEVTWTGAVDNNWHNASNWSTSTVPTSNDNVTIPNGTPTCQAYGTDGANVTVGTLENNGNLEFHGGSPGITDFQNNGDVTLHSFGDDHSVSFLQSSSTDFDNYGTISGSNCGLFIVSSDLAFNNQGTINVADLNVNVKDFETSQSSNLESDSRGGDNNVNITCTDNFINNGKIEANGGSVADGTGIKITAKTITNSGEISGANNDLGKGGPITLTGDKLVNNENGKITSGNGEDPSKNGKVDTNVKDISNSGHIGAGRTDTSIKAKGSRDEIYFNDVFIAADSILIAGDSVQMEADTMTFVFNYMKIEDVSQYASLWGDMIIDFYATENGILDLSQGNGSGIISIGYGSINIYCNNIIEPAQGINYVCSPDSNVYPADTTYTNAYISQEFVNDTVGTSGTFKITLQNQSTANKSFQYSISSSKGWATAMNGATQTLEPFQFDSLMVDYNIPLTADTLMDTVTQVLYVPGVFSDTVYSYIRSSFGQIVGIDFNPSSAGFSLYQNYPNPFSKETLIRFEVEKTCHIILKVFDFHGREIAELANSQFSPGMHEVVFDGQGLRSGLYFYTIRMKGFYDMKKMILME